MNKKQLNQILAQFVANNFQITLSNYNKESNFFNIAFTDDVERTLNTTWSKSSGFLNCEGQASYNTLRKLQKIDALVNLLLEEELKAKYSQEKVNLILGKEDK